EMLVEPPVLDGHKRLGEIGRQVDEPDSGAAGVAAIGDERAVVGKDGDVGRALGYRELIDRRQLARVISNERGERDQTPYREHETPVDETAKQRTARPARALGARSRPRGVPGPAPGGWTVGRVGAKIVSGALVAPIEARLDPCAAC